MGRGLRDSADVPLVDPSQALDDSESELSEATPAVSQFHSVRLGRRFPARPRRHAAKAGALALLALAAVGAWALAARGRPEAARLRGTQEESETHGVDYCGLAEEGVEYHTRESLYWISNIASKELCCAECDADPQCGAWTYGLQDGVDQLSARCFLKRLGEDEEPRRVNRSGVVSGLLQHKLRKHGLVAGLLAARRPESEGLGEERAILDNETCPGQLNMSGHGVLSVVGALWKSPEDQAGRVEVPDAEWAVVPHLGSRAYLATHCTAGAYDRKDYVPLKLLGNTLRYTTDISGAGCGCNAQLHLMPMHWNYEASKCHDYFCGHGWTRCGAVCSEVGVQDSNQYAWSSNLHVHDDPSGPSSGYGGGTGSYNGRREWSDDEYGPGARCIDTTWPFQVEVAFPTNSKDQLEAMEVTLSQEGHSCPLHLRIDNYTYNDRNGLEELSRPLRAGVTPVISYWSSDSMEWMDGAGVDGRGPCVKDAPQACPASVRFYGFGVEDGVPERARRPKQVQEPPASVFDTAMSVLHERVRVRARRRQRDEAKAAAEEAAAPKGSDCKGGCDTGGMLNLTRGHTKDGSYSERHDDNSEWEVQVLRLQVRHRAKFTADSIRDVLNGEIVVGKRTGDWIKLAHEPGYAPVTHGGEVLLKERRVTYVKVASGTCERHGLFPIEDPVICEDAAFAIGYFDANVSLYDGEERVPGGCFVLEGEVWVADDPRHMGVAMGASAPICSSMSYATTTTTSSTTSTTSSTETTTTTSTTQTATTVTSTSSTTWGWPSLFCIEVVRTKGYELPLVKEQQKQRASIFECDEYAVFSDGGDSVEVGIGPDGYPIKTIVIPPIKESIGNLNGGATTNSWLNTETFLQVWNIAKKDGRFQKHDWTVKVDPDAVFFPLRLRAHLQPHTHQGSKLYVLNCAKFNPPALYGSMEVFSKGALLAYLHGQWNCRNNLPWHGWGEDYFMSHCMDMLGVGRLYQFEFLSDKRCIYHPCSDRTRVAFHDYKDASPDGSWFRCWRESGGGQHQ